MMTQPKKPGEPTFDEPPDPPDDKAVTLRISQELYGAIVAEAKAARHSINSAMTILLEEALGLRGKWEQPKEAASILETRGETTGKRKTKVNRKILMAIIAGSLALASATPASAWCGPYGCGGYGYDYDNSGAAIGGMVAGMALGDWRRLLPELPINLLTRLAFYFHSHRSTTASATKRELIGEINAELKRKLS
jgi:hypothetical protein